MFKRKRENDQVEETEVEVDVVADDDSVDVEEVVAVAAEGPYDISEVPENEVARIDLGGIQVAGFTDMQLHLEPDEQTGRFMSVVAAFNDAALRLQPYAAPRKGGLWDEMRPNIIESINAAGGDVDEVEGTFGTELLAVVPAVTPDGEEVRQAVRLVGVEGPRWLLHGVFMGAAASEDAATEVFEDVFKQTVVSRGNQPMAPGDVLPIVLPPDATPTMEGEEPAPSSQERPPLEPFERGPEITEIR